jgi:hypothetical protein
MREKVSVVYIDSSEKLPKILQGCSMIVGRFSPVLCVKKSVFDLPLEYLNKVKFLEKYSVIGKENDNVILESINVNEGVTPSSK